MHIQQHRGDVHAAYRRHRTRLAVTPQKLAKRTAPRKPNEATSTLPGRIKRADTHIPLELAREPPHARKPTRTVPGITFARPVSITEEYLSVINKGSSTVKRVQKSLLIGVHNRAFYDATVKEWIYWSLENKCRHPAVDRTALSALQDIIRYLSGQGMLHGDLPIPGN